MDEEPALLTGPVEPVRPSVRIWLATTASITPVAALLGGLVGWFLVETAEKSAETTPPRSPAQEKAFPAGMRLVELAPIVTNLAEPAETWVRLQAAILLDPTDTRKPELVAAQIAEDFLGYLRTISLSSIGGPSGLRHLREDLDERARIRSDGKVREIVIRALVVQ
jgi:flagellar FliL protein